MRILVLTPQLPYPPQQGTAIRNYNIIARLAERHELDLLSFVQEGNELLDGSPLSQHCDLVETVRAPHRSLNQRLLSTVLSPLPDMALRLWSESYRQRLTSLVQSNRYDVVQIEGIEMAPYGLWLDDWRRSEGQMSRPRLVFDNHNAEYLLQQRVFETDIRRPSHWLGAAYSLVQWRKLRRYESRVCRVMDAVVAVSEADAKALRRLVPHLQPVVIPNGVDLELYASDTPALGLQQRALVFTGKMDFRPNVDAVLWFADEVLPMIAETCSDAHLYVVGQKPHERLQRLAGHPSITVTGWVEDPRPYIAEAIVYVVPLRMGGGTRLKVLEAMSMGKAMVSTTLGCEGFPVTSGKELLIEDSPEDFARAVAELLDDASLRSDLGSRALLFVQEGYDWDAIVPRFEELYLA
jgi:glycosyltransferase involved in cell wall biosynthesis